MVNFLGAPRPLVPDVGGLGARLGSRCGTETGRCTGLALGEGLLGTETGLMGGGVGFIKTLLIYSCSWWMFVIIDVSLSMSLSIPEITWFCM